jgi:hypothetical protein
MGPAIADDIYSDIVKKRSDRGRFFLLQSLLPPSFYLNNIMPAA